MSESSARHALIVTVGQTPAPIEAAITHHAPDGVIFIASQGSHPVAAELIRGFGGAFRHHTLLLADPEDLRGSYETGVLALEQALSWDAQNITADLTGGTKPMVAGLALALSARGVTFSYVGGETRDEFGRVRGGFERIRALEDPSAKFHLLEWGRFRDAWNGWRFAEAGAQLTHILARPLSHAERHFYAEIARGVMALDAWDTFRHAAALTGLGTLENALAVAEAWRHGAKVRVLVGLLEARDRLRRLVAEGGPSSLLLADLLANASRRADAGRFDDALARLYRATELAAEADLFSRHGVNLKDATTMGALSKELRDRARGMLGVREVLDLAYDIDLYFGKKGTLAQRLAGDYQTALKPLLAARHQSILAHGLAPVGREAYEALLSYLLGLGIKAAPAWPRW